MFGTKIPKQLIKLDKVYSIQLYLTLKIITIIYNTAIIHLGENNDMPLIV